MNRAIVAFVVMLAFASVGHAQTYLGDGSGTSGLGGSCCNWVGIVDANGRSCPPDQLTTHPDCRVISSGQYAAYQTAASNIYENKYPKMLLQGIAVTCTCAGYPYGSLDGTYSLIGPDFDNRNLAYLNIKAGGTFPLGQSVVQFSDLSGTLHIFDAPHLLELGAAVQDYRAKLSQQYVNASGWPANNQVTIP